MTKWFDESDRSFHISEWQSGDWDAEYRSVVVTPIEMEGNFLRCVKGIEGSVSTYGTEIINPLAYRKIILYDSETKELTTGSADDIKTYENYGGDASNIVFTTEWADTRLFVVYN